MKHTLLLAGLAISLMSQTVYAGNSENAAIQPSDSLSMSTAAPLVYKTGASSYYSSLLLRFGMMSCDFTKLNGNGSATHQFSDKPLFGGVSFTLPIRVKKVGAFDVCAEYNFIMPQTLNIASGITDRLSGFTGSLGIGTDVFPKNTGFDLIISAGFQAGRFKLKDMVGSAEYDYTKNIFAPQLMVYPRFVLKAISIGLRASYRFDVLSPQWTASQSGVYLPGDASATGYSVEAVIGIILGKGK
jgi:hypothetical protein